MQTLQLGELNYLTIVQYLHWHVCKMAKDDKAGVRAPWPPFKGGETGPIDSAAGSNPANVRKEVVLV